MGIAAVYTEESSFVYKGDSDSDGFQIDLIMDRQDGIINICEMKYYSDEVTIDKAYAKKLRNTITHFKELTRTKKNILLTVVSPYGVKQNDHSIGLIDNIIKAESLFVY